MERQITIRPMGDADAHAIHEIHTECLTKTLRSYYDEAQINAWTTGRTPEGYLQGQATGERFLVAVQNDIVLGFVSWQDEELLALFVRPVAQRTGLGSALARLPSMQLKQRE